MPIATIIFTDEHFALAEIAAERKRQQLMDAHPNLQLSALLEHVLVFGEIDDSSGEVVFSADSIKRGLLRHGDKDAVTTSMQAALINWFNKSIAKSSLKSCPFKGQATLPETVDYTSQLHLGTLGFFQPQGQIDASSISILRQQTRWYKKEFLAHLPRAAQKEVRNPKSGLPDFIAKEGAQAAWAKLFDLCACGEDARGSYIDGRFAELFFQSPFAAEYLVMEVMLQQRQDCESSKQAAVSCFC